MADENEKRISIDDLPRAEEQLTDEEEKGVTGGGGLNFVLSDGSVKFNTVGGSLGASRGNTIGGSLAGDVSNPVKP